MVYITKTSRRCRLLHVCGSNILCQIKFPTFSNWVLFKINQTCYLHCIHFLVLNSMYKVVLHLKNNYCFYCVHGHISHIHYYYYPNMDTYIWSCSTYSLIDLRHVQYQWVGLNIMIWGDLKQINISYYYYMYHCIFKEMRRGLG